MYFFLAKYLRKKERNLSASAFRVEAAHLGYWFFALFYLELLLHQTAFGAFDARILYIAGFSGAYACGMTALLSPVPKKFRFAGDMVATVLLTVFFGSQMVYQFVFGTLYSTALMTMGGAAVTSFWKETVSTMLDELPWVLLLLVPGILLILLRKFFPAAFAGSGWKFRAAQAAGAAVLFVVTLLCLPIGGKGPFSDYAYYHSDSVVTNQNGQRFGLMTAFRLELFGSGGGTEEDTGYYYAEETESTQPQEENTPQGDTVPQETEAKVEYNVLDLDLDALQGMTEDETLKAIDEYCNRLTGTNKNEYTGMLADYNLIMLCAESFSTGAIHPEVTPTLYRLANEGIVFNNYYNSFPNTTTNGEYAFLQGLWPDTSRTQDASSLYASRNSYLPFTMGNIFREQRGVETYGYHNYIGEYYGRNESHPNMGYTMKFAKAGMTFTNTWPASDLEMMQQSVDDYIKQDQFHAYYMTFSGHYKYNTDTNAIARQNYTEVSHLDLMAPNRAYLSCHIELDRAMEYLMQRLEEEGIADKTAIVLAGDHFPYGLTDKLYSELIGYKIDDFTKHKSSLIFWVGGLEENIVVDEYCCNVDILPTILNLWGFDYDSRMLAGTDVFSDGTHAAVLLDKSFFTDKVWFNANTGEVRYLVDESEVPEGYVEDMHRLIDTRFKISSDILNSGYYNHAFGKEAVSVGRDLWT